MLKKIIVLIITCIVTLYANAQYIKPNNSYGTIVNRSSPDSTQLLPTGCGLPSLRSVDIHKGAIYVDSCNHIVYWYDPKLFAWDTLNKGGGGSGGPFYDSVLMKSKYSARQDSIALAALANAAPKIQPVLTAGDSITAANQNIHFATGSNFVWSLPNNFDVRYINRVKLFANSGQAQELMGSTFIWLNGGDSVSVIGGTGLFSVVPPAALYGSLKLTGIGAPVSDSNNYYLLGTNKSTGDVKPVYWIPGGPGGSTDTSWLSKRIDWKPRVFNIDSFGAKGDARRVFDMNFINGSTSIISPTANFTTADIGKHGWSPHAGVAGKGLPFNIVGVTNSTTATISPAASATFSADTVSFGTDNTTATLAALNAAAAAGGGQVYIPSGTRVFSGPLLTSVNGVNPNCILPIPDASIGANFNNRTVIEIVGEIGGNSVTQARLGDSIVQHTGTTLLIQTHGSGQAPALFGTKGRAGSFNYNRIVFSNLNIIAPWNGDTKGPDIGAINCFYCALPEYSNVVAVVDHSLYGSDTPTNNMCAAIITNGNGGETKVNVEKVMVGGYRFGVVSGDHVYAPDLIIQGCYYGLILPEFNFPFSSPKMVTHWTPYSVYAPNYDIFGGLIPHGVSYTEISTMELEPLDVGSWREYQALVVDSGNNIQSSDIKFHFLTGHERQFKRIGAANVNAVALGTYGNKVSSDTTNLLIGDSATHKAWQTFGYDLGGSAVTQYDAHNVPVFVNVVDNNGNTAGSTGAMSGRQNYFYDVPANKFVSYYNSRQQFILGESLLNYGMLINPSVGKGRMSTLTPNGNFVLGDSLDVFGSNKGYSAWAPTSNADIMLFNDGGIASNKGGLIRKLPSGFSAPLGSAFAFFNQDNAPLYFGIGTHINAINFTSGNWTIGQDSMTDIPSALLNMQSIQKGFRAPAMTATQRNAISSPADGLLIYNKTDTCYSYYKGGIGWVNLVPGSGGSSYTLPTASTTVLGGVKIDGTSITISSGVISATGASPAGSANQLQYNGGGVFQANANFTVDPSNGYLGLGKTPTVSLDIEKDQNATTAAYIANTTTNIHARAIQRLITDAGTVQFGLNSIANTDDYGSIVHGSSYIYTSSATNFVIDIDDAAAPLIFQNQTTERMRLTAAGRLGIGVTVPTAFAHLAAATTGAASLRLQSSAGTDVSSPNSGDFWWNGTNLYFKTGSSTVDLLAGGSGIDSTTSDRIARRAIHDSIGRPLTIANAGSTGISLAYIKGIDTIAVGKLVGQNGGNSIEKLTDSSVLIRSPIREIGDYYDDFPNSSTTETDGYGYDINQSIQPYIDGDKFFFTIQGTFVGSATATRTVRAYFGGTQIFTSGGLTNASSNGWELRGWIIRVGSTTARCSVSFSEGGLSTSLGNSYTEVTGLNFSSPVSFLTTLQAGGTGAATNDIVEKMANFEWKRALTIHP